MAKKLDLNKFKNDLDRDLYFELWKTHENKDDPTAEVRGAIAKELEELGYSKTLEELTSSFFNTCEVKSLLENLNKYYVCLNERIGFVLDWQAISDNYSPVLQGSIKIIPSNLTREENFVALARIMVYKSLRNIKETLKYDK